MNSKYWEILGIKNGKSNWKMDMRCWHEMLTWDVDMRCWLKFKSTSNVDLSVFRSSSNPSELCADSNSTTFCVVGKSQYPWVALHLGLKARISRVEVKNREDCCEDNLRDVEIRVTDTLPTTGIFQASNLSCSNYISVRQGDVQKRKANWHIQRPCKGWWVDRS